MKKFLKIDELKEMELEVFQKTLEDAIEEYKAEVDKITDLKELEKELEEVDKILKDDKEYFDGIIYTLPSEIKTVVGSTEKTFKADKIFNDIIYFLNKSEVEWSYVLGLYQLILFWKNTPKEISYGAYDSTLRILQQTKFKGFDEWQSILIINNYMQSCRDGWTRDTNWFLYHNSLHNILLNREQMIYKENNVVDDNEAVQQEMLQAAEDERKVACQMK